VSPSRPTPSRFPGFRIPGNAPVARGGDASPSAVGPLAPTGDRGLLSASLEELEALWDDAARPTLRVVEP
jgi:hypothetical protein